MYRPHRAGEAPQIVHQGASGATRGIGCGIVSCRSCDWEKAQGKRNHRAHDEDCPRAGQQGKNSRKPCPICGETYRPNGSYPTFCKRCFDKWEAIGV